VTDAPTEGDGPWDRLRSRKVVQWGLLYVAGAWGFLQGLEYVSESFHWPDQIRQIAILALFMGLPIALVLAWYHGDRGEQRVGRTELAIITLLFLAGGGIFWLYDRTHESPASDSAAATQIAPAPPAPSAPAPDAKSIAVLPFLDMSPQKDQEYMSDGIAEELLNLLANVRDLKVIARTSSFAFKGVRMEIPDIARKLNVAHVLEGSVRTSGNKVRITAQLIRANDGSHLWSETYDRPLDDIFAVQDEIAGAIARVLQVRLTGETVIEREARTENSDAYEQFLRAWNGEDWNTEASLVAVERYLRRAIELDPKYSMASSALASMYIHKAELGYVDAKEGFARARGLTERALELNPDSAYAHANLLYIHAAHDWDWAAAQIEAQRALSIDPTSTRALKMAARLYMTLGRWNAALQQLRTALIRDPLDDYLTFNVGLAQYRARRFDDAEATLRELIKVSPKFPWARGLLAPILVLKGKTGEALAVAKQDSDEEMRLVSLPLVLWAAGRHDEADEALRAQIEHWGDSGAYFIALTYAYRGEKGLAVQWLEKAYDQRDPGLIEMFGNPLLDNVADDARFSAFLQKMKLPEWPKKSTLAAGK
jgi:TolB-like protein/tetratricopeptide (TPR) repeat protein